MQENIYDRITERLKALGLTEEGASKKAGLARDYLRTLFRQKSSPTVKSLNKLAEALDTTAGWLMNGDSTSEDLKNDTNQQLDESLRLRIEGRLNALGLSEEAASKKAGLDRSYVRQLLRRNGRGNASSTAKLAAVLETSSDWLLTGNEQPHSQTTEPQHNVVTANIPMPEHQSMPLDVPVLGVVAGNHVHGAFQLEASVIDYVRRAPGLFGSKNVYALYVEGDSMAPMHKAGDLLFVHPGRPARIGDSVVVQFKKGENQYSEAMLGILYKRNPKVVELQKMNPPAIVDIDAKTVEFIHRVLTMGDLFGV